jgi:hypothetical protein
MGWSRPVPPSRKLLKLVTLNVFLPPAQRAIKGKVQKGERLLPRSRRAGPEARRDEGPGETEGVSPGAI